MARKDRDSSVPTTAKRSTSSGPLPRLLDTKDRNDLAELSTGDSVWAALSSRQRSGSMLPYLVGQPRPPSAELTTPVADVASAAWQSTVTRHVGWVNTSDGSPRG